MKATKKLIGASCALVAALAVSVGSTFAWFTANNTAEVSGISAQVTTGDSDLEIALVDKESGNTGAYDFNLTLESTLFKDVKLDALTSKSTENGKTLYKRGGTSANDSSDNYIEFLLSFRTKKANTSIVIGTASNITSTNSDGTDKIKGWKDDSSSYGEEIKNNTLITAKAQNAMRGAFIPLSDTYEGSSTTLADVLGDSKGVWCPNEDKVNGADSSEASTTRGQGFWKGNLAKDYEIYQASFLGESEKTEAETEIGTAYTNPGYTGITAGDTQIVNLTNSGDYYTAVVCVRFWIEGTDGDCMNNIFNDTVSIKLVFQTAETPA